MIYRITEYDLLGTSITAGNYYMCTDSQKMYKDGVSTRTQIETTFIAKESDRLTKVRPSNSVYYYVWDTNTLWLYNSGWTLVDGNTKSNGYYYTNNIIYPTDDVTVLDNNGLLGDGSVVVRDFNRLIKGKLYINEETQSSYEEETQGNNELVISSFLNAGITLRPNGTLNNKGVLNLKTDSLGQDGRLEFYGKMYYTTDGGSTWNEVGSGGGGGGGGTEQVQSDWNQTDTSAKSYIKNKPTIPSALSDFNSQATASTIETLGFYKIPKSGSDNAIPKTDLSQSLQDDIDLAISRSAAALTSGQEVITALGYTPYNGSTNPNGYTNNIGTVTSIYLNGQYYNPNPQSPSNPGLVNIGNIHTTLSDLGITATSSEINVLDGVDTALTGSELSVLKGVNSTLTASELNVLDGITVTTGELNHSSGVTSNIQTQLDNKEALGKITINGTEYIVTTSTTDAGTAGYITFVLG